MVATIDGGQLCIFIDIKVVVLEELFKLRQRGKKTDEWMPQ